ncbi:hypothetical protein EOM86_10310 [Candidatus Nomurabacteria bacterium]|nr:hypothetical protein [Candidatus Nomurabacteria bacterium]
MILPNIFPEERVIPVRVPFSEMKIAQADKYELVDLYNDRVLMSGTKDELYKVDIILRPEFVEAILVRPIS